MMLLMQMMTSQHFAIGNGVVTDMARTATGLVVLSLNKSRSGWIRMTGMSPGVRIPRKTLSAGRNA